MKKLFLFLLFSIFLFANSSVLILNSYHRGYTFSDSIINGIENTLYKDSDIDVNVLYMDSKRVSSKKYYESLKKLYKVQLKNRKYDLIIAVDRFAYDFVLDIYKSVFSNEKILAVGIENFSQERLKKYGLKDKVSVILEKRDLKANFEIVKTLVPTLKKLYIVNDKSENALHTEPLIIKSMKEFNGNYELIYLKEKNLDKLKKRFSKKDEQSAILFIRFYKNEDGKLNKIKDIADFIKNSKVPVFVTDSIFVGKGAIGGKVVNLYDFGISSGNMALDILKKNKQSVKISKDLSYVFDSQKINEFMFPIGVFQQEYTLVNKKETFFDKYRSFINFTFILSPFFLILIVWLIRNIILRKKVENSLKNRVDFDAVLLNAIDSPIFWQDQKGVIFDVNKKFCSLVQISHDKLYGKKLEQFIENRNIRKIINVLDRYKKNRSENYEFKYFDENKNRKIYLIKQETFKDKKSNIKGIVTLFTDITKEKEIAEEKQRNKQFIIQQSKLAEIGEVFSSIAHQWKSPLVEITAIAQELFYTKAYKDIKEDDSFVSDIMKQVNYMTDTINDFQKFIIPSNSKTQFDIQEAISSLLEIINHNIKYNNILINIKVQEGINTKILGYKNEFMQSILNIINNAKDELKKVDYKNRKIDINIFEKSNKLFISISDNAGGVDKKNIHKIFRPYYTTKEDGHGIGLYMSKMIIEDKMGGKIFVRNTENGAKFIIELDIDANNKKNEKVLK